MPYQDEAVFDDADGDAADMQDLLESEVAIGRNADFLVINYLSNESELAKPGGTAK